MNRLDSFLLENEDNTIIMGDININCFEINSLSDIHVRNYKEMLELHNYSVMNNAITRFNNFTQNHSVIDHIITQKTNESLRTITSNLSVT